jgi:hypothetical protein
MTIRQILLTLSLIILAVAGGCGLVACGESPDVGELSYSVAPRDGGLIATVSDNRAGKHTVWVVLLNPPKGRHREWYATFNNGDLDENSSQSTSAEGPLPAGTYSYAVYDAEGVVDGVSGAEYWTAEHRIGGGKVTVP